VRTAVRHRPQASPGPGSAGGAARLIVARRDATTGEVHAEVTSVSSPIRYSLAILDDIDPFIGTAAVSTRSHLSSARRGSRSAADDRGGQR